jgi:hypothetical protein
VVHESLFPIDLDDGQPLAMASLELGIAGDVHLDELEAEFVASGEKDGAGAGAEMTTGGVVQRDDGHVEIAS